MEAIPQGGGIEADDASRSDPQGMVTVTRDAAVSQRAGQRFGGLDQEPGVGQAERATSSGRTTGRLGHSRGARVDADDQVARVSRGPREHRSAVAGAEIDDHPVGPGDLLVELADVDVDDAPADDLSHGRQSSVGAIRCAPPWVGAPTGPYNTTQAPSPPAIAMRPAMPKNAVAPSPP